MEMTDQELFLTSFRFSGCPKAAVCERQSYASYIVGHAHHLHSATVPDASGLARSRLLFPFLFLLVLSQGHCKKENCISV